jgi:hypothetical protein
MSRRALRQPPCAALLPSLLVLIVLAALAPTPAFAAGSTHQDSSIVVTAESTRISAELGQEFAVRTTVTNQSAAEVAGLVAHLDVLGFDSEIAIDPEDWSSERTRTLPTLQPGDSVTFTWSLHAVNAGTIGLYVAAVAREGADGAPPFVGPTILADISERPTVGSSGVLPLAVGIPVVLALLVAGLRLRRRVRLAS